MITSRKEGESLSKILLVDADSRTDFPNLALMKISAFEKQQENQIELIKGIPTTAPLEQPDKVYISCIFYQNAERVKDYARQFSCAVDLGGSGLDLKKELPYEIEHIRPDYTLYDFDYSLGFISRGCIRKCSFCVVPTKEGYIKDNAPISEFLHPEHKKIVLLDNNFQSSPRWRENLDFIIENKLKVNFSQGLDIRLVTKEFASKLAQSKFSTWKFNSKRVHFAFDSMRYKRAFQSGFAKLVDAGIKPAQIMVYVLVGFDSDFVTEDIERVRIIRELGADPFIMRYNQTEGQYGILKHYARFINWRVYKKEPDFLNYDYGQSQEAIKAFFQEQDQNFQTQFLEVLNQ